MLFVKDGKLYRRFDKELLCIEAYGENSLRVRATQLSDFYTDKFSALLRRRADPLPRSRS